MIRPHHVALVVLGLAMIGFGLAPACASAAPDQRRRTTFQQQDGVTCTPVPGVGLRCSDGRVSSTTRATVAQCETDPGVWTDVGVNVPCVNWRGGLESWGANTSYVSNANSVSGWSFTAPRTLTPLTGKTGLLFEQPVGGGSFSSTPSFSVTAGDSWTVALDARSDSGSTLRRTMGGPIGCVSTSFTLTTDWTTYTYNCTPTTSGAATVTLDTFSVSSLSAEIRNVLAVKGTTPGRPVWCGTAPCTVATDVHTISTTGWPTDTGSVTIRWRRTDACPGASSCFILDGRKAGSGSMTLQVFYTPAGVLQFSHGGTIRVIGSVPAIGVDEILTVGRSASGDVYVRRDGVEVYRTADAPLAWSDTATLGNRYAVATGIEPLTGTISRLSWSAK